MQATEMIKKLRQGGGAGKTPGVTQPHNSQISGVLNACWLVLCCSHPSQLYSLGRLYITSSRSLNLILSQETTEGNRIALGLRPKNQRATIQKFAWQ